MFSQITVSLILVTLSATTNTFPIKAISHPLPCPDHHICKFAQSFSLLGGRGGKQNLGCRNNGILGLIHLT